MQRNGLLRHFQKRVDTRDRHVHFVSQFFRRGFATKLLRKLFLRAPELVHDFNHVHRNTDGARLIGNRARDGLANPPDGVGGKFIAAAILKFFDAFHQTDVAFLNQIQKRLATIRVFFGDGNDEAQIGLGHVRFGLEAAIRRRFQRFERLEKFLTWQAHELFQRGDFLLLSLDGGAFFRRVALGLQFRQIPNTRLEFFVDVAGNDNHFLDYFLLVEKFDKGVLQFGAQFLEILLQFFLAALLLRFLPCQILRVHVRIHRVDLFDELAQIFQMTFAVGDFFVNNHAVKTLLRRVGQNLFRDGDVFLRRKAEVVDDALHLHFRVLDFFADLHFLFAREQRHLAHLVHIHPHRVVQNLQPRVILGFFRLRLFRTFGPFGAFGFSLIHDDFHVEAAELGQQRVEVFRT